jgi:RNA polymerase sigma-70 factor (ECF subfamily)
MESSTDVFTAVRPLLFSLAYRMLGSVMDAEDVVQDAFLRWQQADQTEVQVPQAWLTTVVTRLAINRLKSARSQRETYVGPWLPEPLVTVPDSSGQVELAESLSMAFLVLLERLTPVERAVFLLHEVFDLEYAEIATIVGKTEANCRQLVSRARKRIGDGPTRFEVDPSQAEQLAERFQAAAAGGDLDALVGLLAEDITLWADGGGKAPGAVLKPVHGAQAVARLVINRTRTAPADRIVRVVRVNGEAGAVIYSAGEPRGTLVFEIRGGRIQTIYVIANPDKLQKLPRPA